MFLWTGLSLVVSVCLGYLTRRWKALPALAVVTALHVAFHGPDVWRLILWPGVAVVRLFFFGRYLRIIGLTGGIATGKSTVSKLLRDAPFNATVVDADELARRVVRPGWPALAALTQRFGDSVLTASGELDREKLGKMMWEDDTGDVRRAVNKITHPAIGRQLFQDVAVFRWWNCRCVVLDAALLVEVKPLRMLVDAVIVVDTPKEVQLRRLMVRDGCDKATAAAKVSHQVSRDVRLQSADFVITNDQDGLESLKAKVSKTWEALGNRCPALI